jgi:hypothetical protein
MRRMPNENANSDETTERKQEMLRLNSNLSLKELQSSMLREKNIKKIELKYFKI